MPDIRFQIANANSPGPSDREGPRSVPRNAYDAENRLVLATPATLANGAVRVLNAYDHRHRRIRKIVQPALPRTHNAGGGSTPSLR